MYTEAKIFMKRFFKYWREHVMKIIDNKKEKINLLTKEQQESYENSQICYVCKEIIENK